MGASGGDNLLLGIDGKVSKFFVNNPRGAPHYAELLHDQPDNETAEGIEQEAKETK